ncbi:7140_t:CDS:2, partial [Entrophospora sp. SA101]
YLLEYYSNNAIEHIGWMITVSTTLPLLFQSHLEDYVYDLFYKECFTDNNIGTNFKLFLDKELTDNSIGINFKLKEDTESNLLQNSVKKIPFKKIAFGKDNQNRANETKEKTAQKAEGKNKHNTVPFNLCVVPLPNFTVNKIEKKNVQKNVVIACLRHLILPYKYIVETTIIVKSFEIEDAFGSVKPDQGTIAAISFSMLFLWIEFLSYLRLFEESKVELLRLQAAFILEFDALDLDDFLNSPKPDPKYICHNNNNLDAWKERTKSRRGCLYAKYENENSYIQYVLEKKDFDHQAGSLWQFHKGLDDFNDDGANKKIKILEEKISNLEKKMDIIISLLAKP